MSTSIKTECNHLRARLRDCGHFINQIKRDATVVIDAARDGVDKGEVLANITLSFRHIEDAIMRLGKTIQALDGGVSCYDDSAKQTAAEFLMGGKEQAKHIVARCLGLEQPVWMCDDEAMQQKVAACKEQASDRRIEDPDPTPAPFHSVPAKQQGSSSCCSAPAGHPHSPGCCNSKSYSP